MDKPNGLAVLGVIIKIGKSNAAFNKFLKYIHRVKSFGESRKIPAFDVRSLLPRDTMKFYRYAGSLTTPPCFDTVTWTVFYDPVEISKEQLYRFRSLKDDKGKDMSNNFRPVQKLHGRAVFSSFQLVNRIR
ncbi:carbonic anhydrase 12-like [Xenia sp. Carnegie-2017]|uniref:carbonic anhydrase 12-like n=1 Tax=Xenia sp. Carnegie-2017 TaxID=2897299 RepID=UPI001F035C0C|nr:carbonic anhydrase 12-like [Xenia sp. Carnegie-2017]